MTGWNLFALIIIWLGLLALFIWVIRRYGLYQKKVDQDKHPREEAIKTIKKLAQGKSQGPPLDGAEIEIVASCLKSWLKDDESGTLGK